MRTIQLDITNKTVIPLLNVKQGDVGAKFKVQLTDGGEAYQIPGGVMLSVWYSSSSGEGNYTKIGNRSAFQIDKDTVTVELITQMLACKGGGSMCLVMNKGDGTQLGLWNIPYFVEGVPGVDSEEAQCYYTAFSEATAEMNQTISVAEDAAVRAENAACGLAKMRDQMELLSGHIDSFHQYLNLTDAGIDKMLLSIAANLESGRQKRCIINVNQNGLALDPGYWFFEITRRDRYVQLQGRLGSKTAYRTFHDSMLPNGYFEKTMVIPGWSVNNHAIVNLSTVMARTGSYSIEIYDTGDEVGGHLYSDPVPVTPGANYTATAFANSTVAGNIWVRFLDEDGNTILQKVQDFDHTNKAWKSISVSGSAPVNAKTAYVVLATYKAGSGIAYFDDASLVMDGTAENLLSNPSFEEEATIPGWYPENGSLVYKKSMMLSSEISTDENGHCTLKLLDKLSTAGVNAISDKFGVVAGVKYTASAKVCSTTDGASAALYMRFFDKDGNRLTNNSAGLNKAYVAGGWKDLTLTLEAPDNAATVLVLLTSTTGNVGTVYFDNVTLIAEGDPKPGFSKWSIIDAAVTPSVYSGSDEPDDALGKDGDIYIQFEE